MDRQKSYEKNSKTQKLTEKAKPSFSQDLKTIKENLKISEILRTVKINNSFRMKAPKGAKIITETLHENQNDKPYENDKFDMEFEDLINTAELLENRTNESFPRSKLQSPDANFDTISLRNCNIEEKCEFIPQHNIQKENLEQQVTSYDMLSTLPQLRSEHIKLDKSNRKYSLDQALLTRRGLLTQSEIDLNSVGKLPLERKSSFFRKKLDSFVKNTSEVFKRQSFSSTNSIQRKNSTSSYSLHSLTDLSIPDRDMYFEMKHSDIKSDSSSGSILEESRSSEQPKISANSSSLASVTNQSQHSVCSTSQASLQSERGSQNNLNEIQFNDGLLASRTYSVSSGLDSVCKPKRSQSSRTNRLLQILRLLRTPGVRADNMCMCHRTPESVDSQCNNGVPALRIKSRFTWLASDSVADYIKRLVQTENGENSLPQESSLHQSHSFQDVRRSDKLNTKGRRISYVRAVSGEESSRKTSNRRRRKNLESAELISHKSELVRTLEDFTKNGLPPLQGFQMIDIGEAAFECLGWACDLSLFDATCTFNYQGTDNDQSVVKELIHTEAAYIKHLMTVVQVYLAAAHALQDRGMLLDVNTEMLFSNLPDVLNASLAFWVIIICPMIFDAIKDGRQQRDFNTDLMYDGFEDLRVAFIPYERYIFDQNKRLDYLRSLQNNTDFQRYVEWCCSINTNRLTLSDLLIMPIQRLTKYPLIFRRILVQKYGDVDRDSVFIMTFVSELNVSKRQKEELELLENTIANLEKMEVEAKDEDVNRLFYFHSNPNLKDPMKGCLPFQMRCLIFEGDYRFKDAQLQKSIEVRVFIFTDVMIITKKIERQGKTTYQVIRPKYMLEHVVHYSRRDYEHETSISFVLLDALGTASGYFSMHETARDTPFTVKLLEQRFREAKITYHYSRWVAKHPKQYLSELKNADVKSEYVLPKELSKGEHADDPCEKEARERVKAMLHRLLTPDIDFSFLNNVSEGSRDLVVREVAHEAEHVSAAETRSETEQDSTEQLDSTEHSRLSSFQQSASATSTDEPMLESNRDASTDDPNVASALDASAGSEASRSDLQVRSNKAAGRPPVLSILRDDAFDNTTIAEFENSNPSGQKKMAELKLESIYDDSKVGPIKQLSEPTPGPSWQYDLCNTTPSIEIEESEPLTNPDDFSGGSSLEQTDLKIEDDMSASSKLSPNYPTVERGRPRTRDAGTSPPRATNTSPKNLTPKRRTSPTPGLAMLNVQPHSGILSLMHSLPDLSYEEVKPEEMDVNPKTSSLTAAEKMYLNHQEILNRNRLAARQNNNLLSPDSRGISYPPPTPTRGALRRGLAFSYSIKNPPLSKMGHVLSQSHVAMDQIPGSSGLGHKIEKGVANPVLVSKAGKHQEKSTKKSSSPAASFFSAAGWYNKDANKEGKTKEG